MTRKLITWNRPIDGLIVLMLVTVCTGASSAAAKQIETAPANKPDQPAENLLEKEWIELNPTGSWANFEMPYKPRFVERVFTPVPGRPPIKVRQYIGLSKDKSTSFVFTYNDMNETPRGAKAIDDTLEGAIRVSLVNVNGQLLNEPRKIKLKKRNIPGRQYVLGFTDRNDNEYVVIARVFLKKNRMFQLSVIGKREIFDETVAARFLNFFDVVKPKSDLPPIPDAKP